MFGSCKNTVNDAVLTSCEHRPTSKLEILLGLLEIFRGKLVAGCSAGNNLTFCFFLGKASKCWSHRCVWESSVECFVESSVEDYHERIRAWETPPLLPVNGK